MQIHDINTKHVLIHIKSRRNFAEYPNLNKSQTNPYTFTEEIYLHKIYNIIGVSKNL